MGKLRNEEAQPTTKGQSAKPNRRHEIIAATERLIRSRGLAVVTTRQISQEAGCSEGALYVHFRNRAELLRAVLDENLQDALKPVKGLQAAVGRRTPQKNLAEVVRSLHTFQQRMIPMAAGLFAERELLIAYRTPFVREGKGPHLAMARIAGYIRAEQKLGRIENHVDADMAATVLISSAFFRAFLELFFEQPVSPAWNQFVKRLVASTICNRAPTVQSGPKRQFSIQAQ
jgi:AcrR family transcriptional regulator